MFRPIQTLRGTALALALFLSASASEAGVIHYTFSGSVDFGALLGESYSGTFSFDDAGLTGTGSESLPLLGLSFGFHSGSFDENSGSGTPTVDFLDGVFLGLSYDVTGFDPDFSFVSGSLDTSDAYFAYTPDNGTDPAGFGSLVYSPVPVPGTLALLAVGGLALRRARTGRA